MFRYMHAKNDAGDDNLFFFFFLCRLMVHKEGGMPKRILMEETNLKKCKPSMDLAQDRSKWSNKIHITNPTWLGQGYDDDDDYYLKIFYTNNFLKYFVSIRSE